MMKNITKNIIGGIGIALMLAVFVIPSATVSAASSQTAECVSFEASKTHVQSGDRVDLSWETENGTRLSIEPDIYKTIYSTAEVDQGDVIVHPRKTTTYTLTVYRNNSSEDECSVKVTVGETTTTRTSTKHTDVKVTAPKVVSIVREQAPVSAVSLSNIPYTGLNVTPFLMVLFFLLLGVWVAGVLHTVRALQGTPSRVRVHNNSFVGTGSAIPHGEYRTKVGDSIK